VLRHLVPTQPAPPPSPPTPTSPPQASAPHEIVSFTNCFHGRTMGALALTYKEQYKTPFLPIMPGAVLAEYNNLESAAQVRSGALGVVVVVVGLRMVPAPPPPKCAGCSSPSAQCNPHLT
jgi:hypothetical protein